MNPDPSMDTICPWCGEDPQYRQYHDEEWGVPVHDDHRLFEFLTLEGAQAGLSWLTILRKRDRYHEVFAGFDPARVARFTSLDVEQLMADPGIVRNRLKIESTISNARAFLDMQASHGSFDEWLWSWVEGRPIVNHFQRFRDIPTTTPLAEQLSRALKKNGFRFVGPTIVYAFMQAVGMVNDHLLDCPRHAECAAIH
jgi:DNA-3-methyladenine glycosylase I